MCTFTTKQNMYFCYTQQLKITAIYQLTVPLGQESGMIQLDLLLRVHMVKMKLLIRAAVLIWASGSSSKLTQAVDKIQCLACIGLRFLISCKLSTRVHSVLRGCSHAFSLILFYFQTNNKTPQCIQSHQQFNFLTCLPLVGETFYF